MSEMKEKMHTGDLYLPGDEEIVKEQVQLFCRVLRKINEHDRKYYSKDRKILR